MPNPVYELTLHKTYYDDGFFNLGVGVEGLVRPDNGPVTIELGGSHRSIEGRVDRNANQNGTPRVFGGAELRNWLQNTFSMGDRVQVQVLRPDALRIAVPDESQSRSLEDIGFQKLTIWRLVDDRIKPAGLDWKECSSWIYAFVVENRPRYFGITNTVLRSRLDHYSYQAGDRVRKLILSELASDRSVEIHGLQRVGLSRPELEAEESRLIREFDTGWNVRR